MAQDHPASEAAESAAQARDPAIPPQSLGAVFLRFLRFGALAWGGPVAQIGMIKRELVDEERWISVARFNRALAVYQVLPGPEAHELCVYFGMLARGRVGAVLAGLGFMLPGLLLMLILSWAYVTVGLRTAGAVAVFAGIQAAVVALVVRAVHRIGKHALRSGVLWAIATVTFIASLLGAHFAIPLVAAGIAYALVQRRRWALAASVAVAFVGVVGWSLSEPDASGPPEPAAPRSSPALPTVAASGLKAGLLTFGGAYTAVPLLQQDAVVEGGWMSNAEFLDGIALGGILPAPLIIFGTFVGFVAAGLAGALLLTLGMFVPAFLFTLLGHGTFERATEHPLVRDVLDGITGAVVGLIAAAAVTLGRAALVGPATWSIAAVALLVLYFSSSRATIPLVILAAGLAGFLVAR